MSIFVLLNEFISVNVAATNLVGEYSAFGRKREYTTKRKQYLQLSSRKPFRKDVLNLGQFRLRY